MGYPSAYGNRPSTCSRVTAARKKNGALSWGFAILRCTTRVQTGEISGRMAQACHLISRRFDGLIGTIKNDLRRIRMPQTVFVPPSTLELLVGPSVPFLLPAWDKSAVHWRNMQVNCQHCSLLPVLTGRQLRSSWESSNSLEQLHRPLPVPPLSSSSSHPPSPPSLLFPPLPTSSQHYALPTLYINLQGHLEWG